MRILRYVCTLSSLILLLWLGVAAFGVPRPPQGDNRDNRQDKGKPEEQPKPQQAPRPQEQPRPQAQPKPQEAPRPQAQPRAQEQPRPQQQPKPQEAPRAQTQPRPQTQPRQQEQARPQEQPKPQQNRAPQQNARAPQPNENRGAAPNANRGAAPNENRNAGNANRGEVPSRSGNTPAPGRQEAGRAPQGGGGQQAARQGHTAPTTQDRQRAQSFQSARRVPQSDERNVFQQRRATGNWQSAHRDWRERGGYNGFRIPDARFNLYFGRTHYFHLYSEPLVFVGGYPEFRYEGYWFEILDPIPPDWGPDFFQTDDCWIDWDPEYGGYYLYDANFPGEAVAVDIVSG